MRGTTLPTGVRIHGLVERSPISYPVKSLWGKANSSFESSLYPLILTDRHYSIGFDLLANTQDNRIIKYYSIENILSTFLVKDLPFTHRVELSARDQDNTLSTDMQRAEFDVEIRKNPF